MPFFGEGFELRALLTQAKAELSAESNHVSLLQRRVAELERSLSDEREKAIAMERRRPSEMNRELPFDSLGTPLGPFKLSLHVCVPACVHVKAPARGG